VFTWLLVAFANLCLLTLCMRTWSISVVTWLASLWNSGFRWSVFISNYKQNLLLDSWFLSRDTMHNHCTSCQPVPVCLSVMFVDCFQMAKDIKLLSRPGSSYQSSFLPQASILNCLENPFSGALNTRFDH